MITAHFPVFIQCLFSLHVEDNLRTSNAHKFYTLRRKYSLKYCFAILFCIVAASPSFAQYYLRGEIKNPQGNPLSFAKITLSSKGTSMFSSGSTGGFGIPLSQKSDTITVSLDGYETLSALVMVNTFQSLVLTPLKPASALSSSGLMSVSKNNVSHRPATTVAFGAETYTSLVENDFTNTVTSAETSIALNINCASYSNIRRFLNMESKVPPDGVRIEEMLNYFNLNSPTTDTLQTTFRFQTNLTTCPWNYDNRLFFVSIFTPRLLIQHIQPAKFVFLIDVSGSMDKDNRLPLVQAAFKLLVNNLRAVDTVGIVTYGGSIGIALQPTSGDEKEKIIKVIDGLYAEGDTPGSEAIQTAYTLAEKIYDRASNNRLILATDGDFNIGQTSDKELENIVSSHKQSGIYLTCLGIGMGNYKDSRLEMLAKKGNGNFAYIDNIQEAQKTMVTEFTKNMYAVANNALLDVKFNEKAVKSYRLIGYDNKKDALSDTLLTEGGEIGSGQNIMAVFEIEPAATEAQPLAHGTFRYQQPDTKEKKTIPFTAGNHKEALDSAEARVQMAASICMFGSLLKHSKYSSTCSWEMLQTLAQNAANKKSLLQMQFVDLISKAKNIYVPPVDKKKKK